MDKAKAAVRCLVLTAILGAQARPMARVIALQHVNVVDVRDGRVLADRTVIIEQGRITATAPADSLASPTGATLVDGRGKYLIPGLWDMHVHAAWPGIAPVFAPLFVANGVTGVREMYGAMDVIHDWKARFASGEPWPRMIGAGHILDGPRPFWPGSVVASTAEQARHVVDSLHAVGADFIKAYTGLPREAYVAALDEAKRVGTTVVGHVPDAVPVAEASDLGQRSIEHLTGMVGDCSRDAEVLRAERAAALAADTAARLMISYARQTPRILATQDSTRCADLIARLARNGTWQTPTLVTLRNFAFLDEDRITNDPRVRYMPPELVRSWDRRTDIRFRARTAAAWANAKRVYQRNVEILGAMQRAGVPILAGTDALNPYSFPGFSLHDELELLVEAGLPSAEALRAATLNPAVFFGLTDSLGTVEVGRRPDLVLLDANPLEDIRHTRDIRAVVLNGRWYDRKALDRLMANAERLAHTRPSRP